MAKGDGQVLNDDDVKFLDGVTGKEVFSNEEDDTEEKETAEEEEEETGEEEEEETTTKEEAISKDEIAALEKKIGRKLSEEEIAELAEKTKGEEIEIPEDFSLIDPNKLPKEIQPHFKRMFASFTKKMQGIADISKKAEIFDYLQEHPEFIAQRLGLQMPKAGETKTETGDEVTAFLNSLNIPEDHELAPAMKGIATALVKLAKGVEEKDQTTKKDTLQQRINSFLDLEENKGVREDIVLVRAMDRLGKENPSLYNDLRRLKRLAEADLGRPAKVIQQKTKENVYKLFREMREAKKNRVEKPSSATSVSPKRAKNVKEAWKQAEEQLATK